MALRIWSNVKMTPAGRASFVEQLAPHELLGSESLPDHADIAFGQPDVLRCLASERLAWVHLSSAGWDKFNDARVRSRFSAQKAALTTSSGVYSEPCAQQVLAFMLAEARQLPRALQHQLTDRSWQHGQIRKDCQLLGPETTVVLVGFGSIGARIAELLAPFGVHVIGARRQPSGAEKVRTIAIRELPQLLSEADHVVNLLPGGSETARLFDASLFWVMKPGAVFYNIGRGSTVDQAALVAALESGRLRAAYLDVVDPEPLPAEHPLWRAPSCTITPHAAGGHADEPERLVAHFVRNLTRYIAADTLLDRVI